MNQVSWLDNQQLDRINRSHLSSNILKPHKQYIKRQLSKLGADHYDLLLPETGILPLVIRPDERLEGIVYGKYKQETLVQPVLGRGALVATNQRILLIDRKPLYLKCDELSYRSVSAITYSRVGFAGTVVLHTRMGDIKIRTFNQNCAYNFVKAIESSVLMGKEQTYGYVN